MTGMDDLVTWLRAQLSDDEREAHEQKRFDAWVDEQRGDHVDTIVIPPLSQLGSAGDPDRVLAEVDAKRRILDEHQRITLTYWPTPMCGICADPEADAVDDPLGSDGPWTPNAPYPCPTVRLLALPYAGRDGYREEWRPDVR